MHDAAFFERSGVPSAALVSSEFLPQAWFQAHGIGAGHVRRVAVRHPMSDQTVQQMHAKADACYATVLKALAATEFPQTDYAAQFGDHSPGSTAGAGGAGAGAEGKDGGDDGGC